MRLVLVLNRELLFLPTTVIAALVHALLNIPQKLSIVLHKMKDDHSQTKWYLFMSRLADE